MKTPVLLAVQLEAAWHLWRQAIEAEREAKRALVDVETIAYVDALVAELTEGA